MKLTCCFLTFSLPSRRRILKSPIRGLSNEDVDANNNGKKEMGLAMFTLCWIAFGPLREPYRIVLLFIHKNGDFGATSVAERS